VTRERLAGAGLFGMLAILLVWNVVMIGGRPDDLGHRSGVGEMAPAVDLHPLAATGARSLAELRGQVVLIDFWATWCKPCRQTMPIVERLWRKHQDHGFTVVSIDVDGRSDDEARQARAFAARFDPPLTFPMYLDDGTAGSAFHVDAIPHLILVDKSGRVAISDIGILDENELDEKIQSAPR